jgi:hypothetical protein
VSVRVNFNGRYARSQPERLPRLSSRCPFWCRSGDVSYHLRRCGDRQRRMPPANVTRNGSNPVSPFTDFPRVVVWDGDQLATDAVSKRETNARRRREHPVLTEGTI